jgi:hypothetical protein
MLTGRTAVASRCSFRSCVVVNLTKPFASRSAPSRMRNHLGQLYLLSDPAVPSVTKPCFAAQATWAPCESQATVSSCGEVANHALHRSIFFDVEMRNVRHVFQINVLQRATKSRPLLDWINESIGDVVIYITVDVS